MATTTKSATKSPATRKRGSSALVEADPSTPPEKNGLVFGVVLNFKGVDIPISTASLNEIAKEGIEFTLPQRVTLGTLDDFTTWLENSFHVDLPDWKKLPSPLVEIGELLTTLEVSVDELHVKLPGTEDTKGKRGFTVGFSGMWPGEGKELIPNVDLLKIRGVFLGATNEADEKAE